MTCGYITRSSEAGNLPGILLLAVIYASSIDVFPGDHIFGNVCGHRSLARQSEATILVERLHYRAAVPRNSDDVVVRGL